MIPFLHLGPLTIPTFGLMVATALFVAAYVLQAEFDRRRESLEELPGYGGGGGGGVFGYRDCGDRGAGGRAAVSRAGESERIFCRSVAAAVQPVWVCVVRRISGWI